MAKFIGTTFGIIIGLAIVAGVGALTGLFLSYVLSLFGIAVTWWACWMGLIAVSIVGRALFGQTSK